LPFVNIIQGEARRLEAERHEAERARQNADREKEKELEMIRKQYLVRGWESECVWGVGVVGGGGDKRLSCYTGSACPRFIG
jgi:hypothetical protein